MNTKRLTLCSLLMVSVVASSFAMDDQAPKRRRVAAGACAAGSLAGAGYAVAVPVTMGLSVASAAVAVPAAFVAGGLGVAAWGLSRCLSGVRRIEAPPLALPAPPLMIAGPAAVDVAPPAFHPGAPDPAPARGGQCRAIKRDGDRCTRRGPQVERGFCGQHRDQRPA